MRWLSYILLTVTASVLVAAVVRDVRTGEDSGWLGTRTIANGQTLAAFDPQAVEQISFEKAGEVIRFRKGQIGWNIIDEAGKVIDRADAFRLARVVDFLLKGRVVGTVPTEEADLEKLGLTDQAFLVSLEDPEGETFGRFKIGEQTPWVEKDEDEQRESTVYVQPWEDGLKETIAIVGDAGTDIARLAASAFSTLSDARPFFFNPTALDRIQLRTNGADVTLIRADVNSPWQIARPIELKTDPAAVKALIIGLVQLQAERLERTENDLPPVESKEDQISLSTFSSEETITLSLEPKLADSGTRKANVNDRQVTFDLPVSQIDVLPRTLNQLRFKKLTSVAPPALKSVSITGPGTDDILLTRRNPREVWQVQTSRGLEPTNELALYGLFSVLAQDDVASFATDALLDASTFGLDAPFMEMTILGFDGEGLLLSFGKNAEGQIFARRNDEPNVVEIAPDVFSKITTTRSKWRDHKLWNLSRVDIQAVGIRRRGEDPLLLTYDFISENWTAALGTQGEVTADLLVPKANKLLEHLEKLKVFSWLAKDDEVALEALRTPIFSLQVFQKNRRTGQDETLSLVLARATETAENRFFYGFSPQEDTPFIMDLETVTELATPLLEDSN